MKSLVLHKHQPPAPSSGEGCVWKDSSKTQDRTQQEDVIVRACVLRTPISMPHLTAEKQLRNE